MRNLRAPSGLGTVVWQADMRFGGHESFPLREGWLSKALTLLGEDPELFSDDLSCDRIGVGRNMAKSIQHWLRVSGLVVKGGRSEPISISKIGQLIMRKDPYFLRIGTWWALHINIAYRGTDAVAWHWFFNRFHDNRFDRMRCSSELLRLLRIQGQRLPSPRTLSGDINCLLSSYAAPVPPADLDPEEGHDCPFRSLGLVTHLRETDIYQVNRKTKDIPSAIVGYALAVSSSSSTSRKYITQPLDQTCAAQGSPGKTLALNSEVCVETIQQAEEDLGSDHFHVEMSGGERTVRYLDQTPDKWLRQYYRSASR